VERQDPKNAAAISATSTRRKHVSGIVAEFIDQRPTSSASSPPSAIPQVLRNINAFTLGAKLRQPETTTQ